MGIPLLRVSCGSVAGWRRVSVPEVFVGHRSLRKDHFKLSPDAVAAVRQSRPIRAASPDPDDLVVPDLAGSIWCLTAPVVVDPGVVPGKISPAFVVAAIPLGIPLHAEVVRCVSWVAPDRAVKATVNAIRRTVEDPGRVVVTVLVKSAGRCRQRKRDQEDRENRNEQSSHESFFPCCCECAQPPSWCSTFPRLPEHVRHRSRAN